MSTGVRGGISWDGGSKSISHIEKLMTRWSFLDKNFSELASIRMHLIEHFESPSACSEFFEVP